MTTRSDPVHAGGASRQSPPRQRSLAAFFLLAVLITWPLSALPVAPTYGPMLAAMIVVGMTTGVKGLRALLMGVVRWRVRLHWWLAAISPVVVLAGILAGLSLAGQELPSSADFARGVGTGSSLGAAGFLGVALMSALGEEVGWRGYALPHLQRRFSPLVATLILAVVWWLWHLGFFLTQSQSGPGRAVSFVFYLVEVAAVAIVLTWLYNRSGGSLLLVTVWHAAYNFASVTPPVTIVLVAAVLASSLLLTVLELQAHRGGRSVLGERSEPSRSG